MIVSIAIGALILSGFAWFFMNRQSKLYMGIFVVSAVVLLVVFAGAVVSTGADGGTSAPTEAIP